MRAFAELPVWSVLKRLTMGLALIALLSSILLVSDLAHRRTASAANAGAGVRKFKAAIVYYAHSVSNDYCVNGLIDGLKASGFEEGKNLEVAPCGCARRNDQHSRHPAELRQLRRRPDYDYHHAMPCWGVQQSKAQAGGFHLRERSDCGRSGQEPYRPLTFRDWRRQFPARKPHAGLDAEAGSGIARRRNHVQPGGSQFGEGDRRSHAKYFRNAASGWRRSPSAGSNEVLQAVQILAGRDIQVVWLPGRQYRYSGI